MLHGYLSCKESFVYQINYFSAFRKVIVPDMAGFGKASMPYPYALSDYARDISLLIDGIGETVDVIAHSFGARVLVKLLPNDRVGKIVLTGAAGLKPRRTLYYRLSVFRYKLRKRLKLPVDNFGSADYKALSPIMRESFLKVVNEHLDKKVKSIKNDCLLVFGSKDSETPPYMARRFKKYMDNSALVFIEGAGHFAFIDEPCSFNVIVKEFLADV